jgi:hypothetical protein
VCFLGYLSAYTSKPFLATSKRRATRAVANNGSLITKWLCKLEIQAT